MLQFLTLFRVDPLPGGEIIKQLKWVLNLKKSLKIIVLLGLGFRLLPKLL